MAKFIKFAWKSAEDFAKKFDKTEEDYKKEYQIYSDNYDAQMAEYDKQNLSGHLGFRKLPYEEWKKQQQKIEKNQSITGNWPKSEEDVVKFYISNPGLAHDYVYNAIQNGKKLEELNSKIVEVAKKYEEEINKKEEMGEEIFGQY